ncbi:hypothetical protein BDP27DRAFT_1451765 [Rhodocollybia butyracea]|uniref:NB-ARC domain-containing protein n=1 Tax=Rhodocollybia butyracea TaxID=206335 RepID=A0A9P5PHW9_9AGAR|nr:hypothetical protein BDP27DRAFT_1451765 [Rhodocollybia butyracea]
MTCFPCWPNSASTTPTSDDEIISGNTNETQKNKVRTDNNDQGAPSKTEYVRETGKELLEVLEAVAEQIPVPGVAIAIKMANNLIRTCENSHATLQQAEVLKKRIKNLAIILVNELKGKKVEEIEEKLRTDIEQLESDLKYIRSKLDEIAAQNAFLVILYQKLNEDKLRGCVERLATALESFNLSRQIADAGALDRLSEQIMTFYKQQQKFEIVERNMESVQAILAEKRYQGDDSSGSSPRRGVIPVAPEIFFGRDAIVADLVHILVCQKTSMARICLLGPGGTGKTSIARTVLNHPSIIEHFGKENRVWVPCVKAASVSLLKDTLYESLGLSLNTGDPLYDILYDLNSSKSPIILLLDNFETPWNLHAQAEVQDILLQLEKLEHVALFVTMRSFQPPGDSIHWESVHLEAVDKEFSIRIYAEIDPTGSQRPELPLLLDEVGHMPLAITLLAKLGRKLESSPAELLEQYQQGGTALLNLGGSAERNMDICIGLSVQSLPMMDSPSAAKLLAVLALLPVGTTRKALSQWWVHDLVPDATIMSGLGTLLDTALVEKRADTYVVLPVIRRYVLHPDRFPEHIWESTVRMACAFLKEHNASLGTSNYLTHKTARSLEEANLQGILLETTAADPDIIEALLILSEHQYETRPRLEVVQHALELSKESEDKKWYAEALYWNGQNLDGLDQLEEAIKQFHLARETFLQVSEPTRAADALYRAGNSSVSTSSPNHQDVQKALAEFQALDDPAGIARCQMSASLASLRDAQSIPILTTTWESCVSNNLLPEQALCTWNLTQTCINLGRFDEAKKWGLIALDADRQISGGVHNSVQLVGQVYIFLGEYDKAVEYLMEGLESSKAYGSPLGIVRILFQLGRAWMKKGQKEDDQGAFMETLKYCEMLPGAWEGPRTQRACRFYLDKLENPTRELNFQEREALEQLGAKEDYETASIAESDGGSDIEVTVVVSECKQDTYVLGSKNVLPLYNEYQVVGVNQ